VGVFFMFSQRLIRFISGSGINVVTRLMGLILAMIGTQMVLAGNHGAQL